MCAFFFKLCNALVFLFVLPPSLSLVLRKQENGWLMNVDEQISKACTRLAGINGLQNGFFGLGLSQGGLFIRGLLQRCPAAQPMKRLISVGGPQQGVESIPKVSEFSFSFHVFLIQKKKK